jgi:hypothetical protein
MLAIKYGNDYDIEMIAIYLQLDMEMNMILNDCNMLAIKYGNDYDMEMIAICLQLDMGMIMIFK